MRRLLACIAVVSAAGCGCYDKAYVDYCNRTHHCDPKSVGIQVENSIVAETPCRTFTLRLLDEVGGNTLQELLEPVKVSLTSYPPGSVRYYQDEDCLVQTTELTTEHSVMNLKLTTHAMGRVTVDVDLPDIDGFDTVSADVMSQGKLQFAEPAYRVTSSTCGTGGHTVTLRTMSVTGVAIPATDGLDVPLQFPPGLGGNDGDGGCLSTAVVPFAISAMTASTTIGGDTAAGPQGEITIPASFDGVALPPQPVLYVSSMCDPAGTTKGSGCCAGLMDTGVQCCMPSGGRCSHDGQCCNGPCTPASTCQ